MSLSSNSERGRARRKCNMCGGSRGYLVESTPRHPPLPSFQSCVDEAVTRLVPKRKIFLGQCFGEG